LEPRLREASRRGDFAEAKRLTFDIQSVLRPTGHETRLQKAKNWLFEAALEAGETRTAVAGFEGVRRKVRKKTRAYLNATVLLAVAHLRLRDVTSAEPLIREALTLEDNITSERKRAQFRVQVVKRLEIEYLVALLADESLKQLEAETVLDEAARLVSSKTEDDILGYLADGVPLQRVEEALRLYSYSRGLLPPSERKLLPSPSEKRMKRKIGGTIWEAVKRVIWRALCDPSSDMHQMWFEKGLKTAVDYRAVAGAVTAALAGMRIGYFGLAVAASAIVIKTGVEVFCEITDYAGVMIAPHE
jgi:hypothetical protein